MMAGELGHIDSRLVDLPRGIGVEACRHEYRLIVRARLDRAANLRFGPRIAIGGIAGGESADHGRVAPQTRPQFTHR